jgi:hypothetical protein
MGEISAFFCRAQGAVEEVGNHFDDLATRQNVHQHAAGTGTSSLVGISVSAAADSLRNDVLTRRTPTNTVVAVINQPDVCTPYCLVTQPNRRANGKNAIQEIVLTPEATPARMVDGTASCNTLLTWMLTATISRARTTCATMTAAREPLTFSTTLVAIMRATTAAMVAGSLRRTLPAMLGQPSAGQGADDLGDALNEAYPAKAHLEQVAGAGFSMTRS